MSDQVQKRGEGRSEYGVSLLLLALGVVAIVDALGLIERGARGFMTARTVPMFVGGLLILCAVLLAVDIARGGRGEQEEGEDVDLSHGSDFRTVGLLAVAFAFNAAFIDRLGWPITGAVLFFGAAFALGNRHYVRLAVISVLLSVVTWYGFFLGLDVKLPAGLLDGIL
ncbi:membrane protein [Knoellia flava TL1]|uniref:Membrane protein n=2 Tax=Knoellia flava TaxID=913969 RepID=A0A8H9KV01_9MICO|nr:tripartite tricarboxylate transporter TctB family protein [Knoellia flava]KGN28778.1 membrane protein [Knoellia flava TL1]GGB85464.1 membrane protein [Knoellia flava]